MHYWEGCELAGLTSDPVHSEHLLFWHQMLKPGRYGGNLHANLRRTVLNIETKGLTRNSAQ